MARSLLMMSGGIDSVVLAHDLRRTTPDLQLIFFDYGQDNARSEMFAARRTAADLALPIEVCDVTGLRRLFIGLTGEHFRMISVRHMLSCEDMALGLAVAGEFAIVAGFGTLLVGIVKEDLKWRPMLPEYLEMFAKSINLLYHGYAKKTGNLLDVQAPYLAKTKSEVLEIGTRMKADFGKTWTCQAQSHAPCNQCPGCTERAAAFKAAKLKDPLAT